MLEIGGQSAMKILLAAIFCLLPMTQAHACIDIQPFDIEGIRNADAIFVAIPLQYERIPSRSRQDAELGFLKVRVESVLKGRVPRIARLVWGSNFGIHDHLDLPGQVIIAASAERVDSYYSQIADNGIDRFDRSQLFHLDGSVCSSHYILDDSPENIANIRMILRGEHVPPHDYRRAVDLVAERASSQRMAAERATAFKVRVSAVVFLVLAFVFGSAVVLRRARARRLRRP